MAARPKGYGMTAELESKKDAKFDSSLATQALEWIVAVIEHSGSPEARQTIVGLNTRVSTANDVAEPLKDGVVLCHLINTIQPGTVAKINTSKMAFKMMENIGQFLEGSEKLGVQKSDMFQTVDLYESVNIPQVVNGIHAVGRKVQSRGWDGPVLGPKEATEEKREFTEEQLASGKHVIGLQMGSNKGASQAGATPYGLGRQIEKTNLNV